MDAQHPPCPWLLDERGAIDLRDARARLRCGADPTRPEVPPALFEGRCLGGGPCAVREERERLLGSLASQIAPQLPIGDPALLSAAPPPPTGRPIWARLLAVGAAAVIVAVLSGPIIRAVAPLFGSASGPATSDSPSPSPTASAVASPTPVPSPTASAVASPTPVPSPTASPAPSGGGACGGAPTYVVKAGDTLSGIARLRCGGRVGYQAIARLNGIASPYRLKVGQVLQLP